MIINESAAYEYKLKRGDKIEIDPTDEATRYNPRVNFNNPELIDFANYNNKKYTFEIVDIVKSYQYPEFYINQRIANHLNVMDYPTIIETSYVNDYEYNAANKMTASRAVQIDP